MKSEIINYRFIPGLHTVLIEKKRNFMQSIWDYWEEDFKIWYCSICGLLYFLYIISKIIRFNAYSDIPRVVYNINLFDFCFILAIILTIPILVVFLIRMPEIKANKCRNKKWKEQKKYPMPGASPMNIKGDGSKLYYESLTPTSLAQNFTGEPYHEPINKIEIYNDEFNKKSKLRMHIYYQKNWGSSVEKEAEADISLDNITTESIYELLKYPNVIDKSNLK